MRTVIKNYKTEKKSVELMSFCMLLIILTKNLQFRESINYNQANSVSEDGESIKDISQNRSTATNTTSKEKNSDDRPQSTET